MKCYYIYGWVYNIYVDIYYIMHNYYVMYVCIPGYLHKKYAVEIPHRAPGSEETATTSLTAEPNDAQVCASSHWKLFSAPVITISSHACRGIRQWSNWLCSAASDASIMCNANFRVWSCYSSAGSAGAS